HLGQIIRMRGKLEVLANAPERLERVRLRDDVQLAADGKQHVAQSEWLEVPGGPTGGASHTFRNRADLALVARKQRKDAIGFAEIHPLENDRGRAVEPLACHLGIIPGSGSITIRPRLGSISLTTSLIAGTRIRSEE